MTALDTGSPSWRQSGDVRTTANGRLVRTNTGSTQVPHTVTDLETAGKRHGWGVLTEIFCDSYGPVIFVSVGRNSGATKGGRYAPGITYRLRWDCAQKGKEGTFVLISRYYRSTETSGSWVKHTGTLYDIHKAMETSPVVLRGDVIEDTEESTCEADTGDEADTEETEG